MVIIYKKISKKKFSFILFIGTVLTAGLMMACSSFIEEKESAESLFKAIAKNDPYAFNWITVEEVDKLDGKDKDAISRLRSFASDIDKNVPPLLAEWRKLGEEVGINWKEVKVDSVNVTDSGDYEQLGEDIDEGYILAQSNGKGFKIRFEQAIEPIFGDGWRTIVLTNFLPLDEKGKVISTITLKQDGSFDEFYRSLAECFQKEAENEIEKIFLTNDKGKRVFQVEEVEKNTWEENWRGYTYEHLRKYFVKCIENNDCVAEEMNPAMLFEYGMVDRFGLDEDEIFNKAQLWKVSYNLEKNKNVEDTPDYSLHFLNGKFMKYKGKWYYLGAFDSGYEH